MTEIELISQEIEKAFRDWVTSVVRHFRQVGDYLLLAFLVNRRARKAFRNGRAVAVIYYAREHRRRLRERNARHIHERNARRLRHA